LADEICRTAFGASMSKKMWDEAWQFRTILHPDFKQARTEFVNAVVSTATNIPEQTWTSALVV